MKIKIVSTRQFFSEPLLVIGLIVKKMCDIIESKVELPTKRTLYAGLGMFVNIGVKVIVNLILVRIVLEYLGPSQFGIWVILQSIVMYLGLSEIGLGQTIMNYQGEAYALNNVNKINILLTTAFGLYWLIVIPVWLLGSLIILFFPLSNLLLYNPSIEISSLFSWGLFIFMTTTLLTIPFTTFLATLSGFRDLHTRQLYELFLPPTVLLTAFVTLYIGGNIFVLIIVTGITQLSFGIGSYFILRKRYPYIRLSQKYWDPQLLLLLLSNSFFFFLISITLVIQRTSGNLLVGRFTELPNITQVFSIFLVFRIFGWSFVDLFSRAIQPYIILFGTRNEVEKLFFFVKLSSKISFMLSIIFAAEFWIFGKDFLRLWLGSNSFIGYGPLALLIGSFLIDVFYLPVNNFLVALNRHKRLSFAMLIYSILTLSFGVLGANIISSAPILGICAGFFAASVFGQGIILIIVCAKEFKMKIFKYLREFILQPFLLTICVITIMYFLYLSSPLEMSRNLTYGIFIMVFIFSIEWIFILNNNERKWLKNKFNEIIKPFIPKHPSSGIFSIY